MSSLSCIAFSYINKCVVGYSVFAFNQTVYKKLDPKSHQNLAQALIGRLERRPGVAFLARITIVLDEDSEKGFGLVSDQADYHPPSRPYRSTLSLGEHEFINLLRLRYHRIIADHSWHLLGRVLDTQSALCVDRACDIAPSDSPPFTVPFETHANTNCHKKRCCFRDELLRCIR